MDECYIYSTPGDSKGIPKQDADILYDTVPDEILQLDVNRRNGNYVWCILPVQGYVYLPQEDAQYDWGPLNQILDTKRRIKKEMEDEDNDNKNKNNNNTGQYDEDGYMIGINEMEEVKSDTEQFDNEPYDPTLIIEERKNYNQQRIMMQTLRPEVETEGNKLFEIKFLRWLIFYFRRHPFLPGTVPSVQYKHTSHIRNN